MKDIPWNKITAIVSVIALVVLTLTGHNVPPELLAALGASVTAQMFLPPIHGKKKDAKDA